MRPGRLGIDLVREGVELRLGLGECLLRRAAQRRVVALVAVGVSGRVDVDVLAVAEAREEPDAEVVEQRVHRRLVRRDPLAAELVGLAADLGVPDASPDPVSRLEHDDVHSLAGEGRRGREPRDPGPDDGYLGLDAALRHPAFLRRVSGAQSRSGRIGPPRGSAAGRRLGR